MKRRSFYLLLLLLVAGCATSPSEAIRSDGGPYPENHLELTRCYLSFKLEDPSSLKDFTVVKPPEKKKADTRYPLIPIGEGDEVWESFIVYDTKNSDGNYIGKDLHVVWIRDLKVVAFDYQQTELDFRIKQRRGNPCAPGE